jgi:hypothetical protein
VTAGSVGIGITVVGTEQVVPGIELGIVMLLLEKVELGRLLELCDAIGGRTLEVGTVICGLEPGCVSTRIAPRLQPVRSITIIIKTYKHILTFFILILSFRSPDPIHRAGIWDIHFRTS